MGGSRFDVLIMKIIFFGTPEFVLPVVNALHKKYNWANNKNFFAVVTQPPKEAGRDKKLTYSAVDKWAYKHKIQIFHDVDNLPQFDLGIVAAYGKIIPENVINNSKYGILNIHPSLLPEFRGASPIQGAIAAGKSKTGVSVIKMDKLMDHGPIVSQFTEEIRSDDTNESLRNRLFERTAEFLIELIPNYVEGKIKFKPQNHKKATYTKLIKKSDGFIPSEYLLRALNGKEVKSEWLVNFLPLYKIENTTCFIERLIRSMNPWPNAWTKLFLRPQDKQAKRIKLLKAHLEDEKLVLDEVQLEGKTAVSWKQLKEGYSELKFQDK